MHRGGSLQNGSTGCIAPVGQIQADLSQVGAGRVGSDLDLTKQAHTRMAGEWQHDDVQAPSAVGISPA